MTADSIHCTDCDFGSSSARAWGDYQYILPSGLRMNVSRQIGWCFECHNIEPIEELPNPLISIQAIDKGERRKAELQSRSSFAQWLKPHPVELSQIDESILAETRVLQFTQARRNPPRCLTCGSFDFCILSIPRPPTGQVLDIGFAHPDCGGQLLVSLSPIQFSSDAYKPRLFDLEGSRLS